MLDEEYVYELSCVIYFLHISYLSTILACLLARSRSATFRMPPKVLGLKVNSMHK